MKSPGKEVVRKFLRSRRVKREEEKEKEVTEEDKWILVAGERTGVTFIYREKKKKNLESRRENTTID